MVGAKIQLITEAALLAGNTDQRQETQELVAKVSKTPVQDFPRAEFNLDLGRRSCT